MEVQKWLHRLELGKIVHNFTKKEWLIFYKKQLYILKNEPFKQKLLNLLNSNPLGDHLGFDKKIQRVRRDFYWPDLKARVKKFTRDFNVCQKVKEDQTKPSGLLQPLPINNQPWTNVTMDFIDDLPTSNGFNSLYGSWRIHQIQSFHPFISSLFCQNCSPPLPQTHTQTTWHAILHYFR